MEKEYAFVVVKEHYTKEEIHEIQCVCFSMEKAKETCERIQNEIDPEYNEWKISYKSWVDVVR